MSPRPRARCCRSGESPVIAKRVPARSSVARTSVDGPVKLNRRPRRLFWWPRCSISMGLTLWKSTLHVRLWGRGRRGAESIHRCPRVACYGHRTRGLGSSNSPSASWCYTSWCLRSVAVAVSPGPDDAAMQTRDFDPTRVAVGLGRSAQWASTVQCLLSEPLLS